MKRENSNFLSEADILADVAQCLKGDNKPFEKIVHHFQKPIYSLCYQFTGTSQDAEDAATEVFIKAYRSLRVFNPAYKFSTWIFRIAVNHCIEIIRKRKREQAYLVSRFADHSEDTGPETPAEIFFKTLEHKQVKQILDTLPFKYQAALMLRYYQELSYQQISEILDIPRNTVASLILRGKKALRERLKNFKEREVSHET